MPYLIPLVPNCSEPAAVQALRNACIDFTKGSMCLQGQLDPMSVAKDVAEYDIDVPKNTRLTQMISLYYLGSLLPRKSLSYIVGATGRDWAALRGPPTMYTQFAPDTVTLIRCPGESIANALTGTYAYVPTRSSTTCDEVMLERYAEAIARGAASKLMQIPNEPFSNLQMAMMYHRQFTADIANELGAINQGQNRASISVHFRRYY